MRDAPEPPKSKTAGLLPPLRRLLVNNAAAVARAERDIAAFEKASGGRPLLPAGSVRTDDPAAQLLGKELVQVLADIANGAPGARQRAAIWRADTVEGMSRKGASVIEIAAAIGTETSWVYTVQARLRLAGRLAP